MSLNIYGCHAGLEMAISELKTASLRIHVQYSAVYIREAKTREASFDKQDVVDFTKNLNWIMCRASEAWKRDSSKN